MDTKCPWLSLNNNPQPQPAHISQKATFLGSVSRRNNKLISQLIPFITLIHPLDRWLDQAALAIKFWVTTACVTDIICPLYQILDWPSGGTILFSNYFLSHISFESFCNLVVLYPNGISRNNIFLSKFEYI